ncbi:4'-phosphopantetheinyl transferase superfamily protein [Sphaerisporangium sp. NBC_01403]|uniref:4'-phosphopantetheinyl transferase superfamily protein n=1 Tax=Sphaerisporangium sp. NBC_01403 TaxID=2903599 RepID=UPI00324DC9D8
MAVTPRGSRVGVDVELIRPDLDCLEMARRMYQPAEVDRLGHADPAARRSEYFGLWSAKEAYVKGGRRRVRRAQGRAGTQGRERAARDRAVPSPAPR